jgi:arylsulfatase
MMEVRAIFTGRVSVLRNLLSAALFAVLYFQPGIGLANSAPPSPINKPNVVIITLDAGRADHVGFYGYKRPTTPEIDQISKESLVFAESYSVAATASMFTSLYPDTHGVVGTDDRLPSKLRVMAGILKYAGYSTLMVANNPFLSPEFGLDRDFGVIYNDPEFSVDRAEKVSSRVISELSKTTLPFFCYVHYLRPHEPYDAPEQVLRLFRSSEAKLKPRSALDNNTEFSVSGSAELTELYDAGYRTVDAEVEKIFAFLKTSQKLENTIVVITADHGEALGEHGTVGHNSTVYDEMIRIPLIFY